MWTLQVWIQICTGMHGYVHLINTKMKKILCCTFFHLLFMKLSCGCWMFYETMCIELTGECSLKDKWLELEWFTSLNASRNSLKSMWPSLSMSILFAKSSMESTGILELVCSLRRRQDSSNSSIETYPVEENEEKMVCPDSINLKVGKAVGRNPVVTYVKHVGNLCVIFQPTVNQ